MRSTPTGLVSSKAMVQSLSLINTNYTTLQKTPKLAPGLWQMSPTLKRRLRVKRRSRVGSPQALGRRPLPPPAKRNLTGNAKGSHDGIRRGARRPSTAATPRTTRTGGSHRYRHLRSPSLPHLPRAPFGVSDLVRTSRSTLLPTRQVRSTESPCPICHLRLASESLDRLFVDRTPAIRTSPFCATNGRTMDQLTRH